MHLAGHKYKYDVIEAMKKQQKEAWKTKTAKLNLKCQASI